MKSSIISLLFLILLTGCTSKQLINNYQIPNNNGNYTLLPNGWKLTPAGENIGVGELPMDLIFTKDEKYAITSNSGMGENTLSVIDLSAKKKSRDLQLTKPGEDSALIMMNLSYMFPVVIMIKYTII